MPKGHYTFKVRSTNSDGVWVDNTRFLDIVVLPSFWETPLAYFLYVLFILLVIFVAVYILFTIYRLKHEVSVEQQVSDIKLRFFTNISHELRTPLTLIAGPVEYVLKNSKLPEDAREQLVVVERNTNRMLHLVNQILDFRKIQNKKMKMQVQRVNVVAFVRKVMDNFESLAEEHNIDFLFETEKDELYLWVDEDKLEKIVFNLLSNAFKYTPGGKLIRVFIHEDEGTVSVGVQDQGIGIAENKKKSLFVRFENLVDKNLFNQASTGIGLSLVKELVEMHKAVISVDSKLGEGSCFKVDFLKGKEHYDDTVEFILEDSATSSSMTIPAPVMDATASVIPIVNPDEDIQDEESEETSNKEVMLLVEDNQELRVFLRTIFSSTYRVVEAADGMEGWSKALKFVPDIIISDVMMPEKDGIEMTKELRADMTTSHIPIVLLTAKTSIESKLEGLEYGADDYITKPFHTSLLISRCNNLVNSRRILQEKFSKQPQAPARILATNPMDEDLLERTMEIIERNMDNSEFSLSELIRELCMSRTYFFQKIKGITGQTPNEFLSTVRLKRAAFLLRSDLTLSISEISDKTGFSSPRYFGRCFKEAYGVSPLGYRNKGKEDEEQVEKDEE